MTARAATLDETTCLPIEDLWVTVSYSVCRASSSLRQAPIAGLSTVRRWKMRGVSLWVLWTRWSRR